jgi:hypothetical protein
MPQSTRRWISEEVKSLREADVLPFHEILDATMVNDALAEEKVTFSQRIYTPLVTLCLFLCPMAKVESACNDALSVRINP